jgi:MFS family permease
MKTLVGAGKLKDLSERTYQGALRAPRRVYERIFAGYGTPFRWLSAEFGASVAGDTLIALGLAGTLFFSVPSAEARDKVALYLLLTLAPYSVIAPLLPRFFMRFPGSYRASLAGSSGGRAVIALLLAVGVNTLWVYPLAFTLLVFSRLHTIAKGSLVPVAVPGPEALVAANGLLARVGIVGGAVAIPIGAAAVRWIGSWPALVVAAMFYLLAALCAGQVPSPGVEIRDTTRRRGRHVLPRIARLPMIATAVVRFINGFLLALLAFVFKDIDAPLAEFGALLVAAGLGYGVASFVSPFLARRLREEPTVMAALAIEAAAAFITAQIFGLTAAVVLAASAGLAWGTAKFGFDALLQKSAPREQRGAAFTRAETIFQLLWVLGALLPVAFTFSSTVGLSFAGTAALFAQVVIVSGLLVEARNGESPD